MTIPVSELGPRAEEIVRKVGREGHIIEVELDGQIVARIVPAAVKLSASPRPWEAMHGKGRLLATPEESVLHDEDFEASR